MYCKHIRYDTCSNAMHFHVTATKRGWRYLAVRFKSLRIWHYPFPPLRGPMSKSILPPYRKKGLPDMRYLWMEVVSVDVSCACCNVCLCVQDAGRVWVRPGAARPPRVGWQPLEGLACRTYTTYYYEPYASYLFHSFTMCPSRCTGWFISIKWQFNFFKNVIMLTIYIINQWINDVCQ